ncbi:MAG: hypothetical protein J7K47_01380 [Thermoplasmata archaeon]|nr:hypothetical protein [Thermoplasmata archaeon]
MDNLKKVMEEMKKKYGLNEIYLTDTLSRIVEKGFLDHLSSYSETLKKFRKALWNYSDGKITEEELYKVAKRSISKSLSTNTRNAYQCWVLLALLNLINGRIFDPYYKKYLDELPKKSRYVSLVSKKDEDEIRPNFMIDVSGKFFSVFYEGPGAIRWRNKEERNFAYIIEKYGYRSKRPDIMIYSEKIDNIYDPNEKPFPIRKNPFMAIECKERADWYRKRRKNGEKESDIVKKYKQIYAPENYFLVSWEETPEKICEELEANGIMCLNNIDFNRGKLKDISIHFTP